MTTNPDTARRIVFPARGEVILQPHTLPAPQPEEVLVRTLYSLMSIGTETTILHQRYAADSHFASMFSFPQLQTGVQAVGEVMATGAAVSEFAAGDRVYMRMAHGSHQLQAAQHCSPIPAAIDLQQACWAGLAKTAFRAACAAQFGPDQHVLIIGAGPVAQMLVRWAALENCASLCVLDLSASRLELAGRGGATQLLHGDITALLPDIQQLNAGAGPDTVIDVTGNPAVFQPALAAAARFGKVILLGDTGYPQQQHLSSALMTKGLTLQATHDSHDRDGWTQRRIDELFFAKLAAGHFPLADLITHRFLPRHCKEAYRVAEQERDTAMGILFDWSQPDDQ